MPQIRALTSIRFFFAMAVVVGHFSGHLPSAEYPLNMMIGQLAPTAVSWFFMLSGFIIAYNYPELQTQSARWRFIASRIARLWPVHVVTLIAAVFIVGPGKPIWFLSQITLTQTWLADGNVAQSYNGPAWSISNEMFFYLAYVAMMLPALWMRLLAVAMPLLTAVAAALLNDCFNRGSAASGSLCVTVLYEFPPARLIEFVAGVALCHLRPRIPQTAGLILPLLVLSCALPWLPGLGNGPSPILWRQFLIIIGGGALICALAHDGWLSKFLDHKAFVAGGEISYSIYMTHQLVMIVALPRLAVLPGALQFLAVASATICISAALFYFVEKPARDAVKALLARPRPSLDIIVPAISAKYGE